ncbi:MAG: hypothetical protein ACLSGB_10240 [Dorea sp.]
MSELALGWATYNGDHMSMYGVNASVPKTLVRHLVQYYAADLMKIQSCRKSFMMYLIRRSARNCFRQKTGISHRRQRIW